MTRSRPLSGLLCALVVVAATPAAHAAALDAARKAYADLAYAACRDQAKAALEDEATLAERVDAYRLLGLCHAALGDTEAARGAFTTMVTLDPEAELPKGLSPRFTSSYLEAKGALLGSDPLALVIEADRTEGKKRVVRVHVKDDAGLVDKVTWEDDEGERASGLKAAERMELELPAEVAVKLLGVDENGGVVVETALAGPEPVVADAQPGGAQANGDQGGTVTGEEDPGAGPWLWVGVAAGAGLLLAGGAAAAVAGVMLSPPDSVTLESQVVFP